MIAAHAEARCRRKRASGADREMKRSAPDGEGGYVTRSVKKSRNKDLLEETLPLSSTRRRSARTPLYIKNDHDVKKRFDWTDDEVSENGAESIDESVSATSSSSATTSRRSLSGAVTPLNHADIRFDARHVGLGRRSSLRTPLRILTRANLENMKGAPVVFDLKPLSTDQSSLTVPEPPEPFSLESVRAKGDLSHSPAIRSLPIIIAVVMMSACYWCFTARPSLDRAPPRMWSNFDDIARQGDLKAANLRSQLNVSSLRHTWSADRLSTLYELPSLWNSTSIVGLNDGKGDSAFWRALDNDIISAERSLSQLMNIAPRQKEAVEFVVDHLLPKVGKLDTSMHLDGIIRWPVPLPIVCSLPEDFHWEPTCLRCILQNVDESIKGRVGVATPVTAESPSPRPPEIREQDSLDVFDQKSSTSFGLDYASSPRGGSVVKELTSRCHSDAKPRTWWSWPAPARERCESESVMVSYAPLTRSSRYCMSGSTGHVTIKLHSLVHPSAVVLAHWPGEHSFAVRDFTVKGFSDPGPPTHAASGRVLGIFSFHPHPAQSAHNDSSHSTRWQLHVDTPVRYVRIEFDSNHGGDNTCIYRLGVLGQLA